MTTEEIENLTASLTEEYERFKDELTVENYIKRVIEITNLHWQEKTRWIPVEERLPVFAGNRRTILVKTENKLYAFLWVMQEVSLSDFEYYKYWKEIE